MPNLINNDPQVNTRGVEQQRQKSNPSDISMDDFLKILAASMSNPTVMGGDSGGGGNAGTDYVNQFIQFTSLQQMTEIGDNLTTSIQMNQQQQAFEMIGREVTIADGDEKIYGKVEKVRFVDGYATVVVAGIEYYLSAVQEVGDRDGVSTKPPVTPEDPATPEHPIVRPDEPGNDETTESGNES